MSYIVKFENFVKTYIFQSSFLPVLLGSQLAENLYFWINLAYNIEELNEKILNGRFSRPCYLPYRNAEH